MGPTLPESDDELFAGLKTGINIDWSNFEITKPFTFPLSSSCTAKVSYNPATLHLFIEFTDGTYYSYSGVPQWVVLDLVRSSSAGRYFNYQIRLEYPYNEEFGLDDEGE